MPEVMIPHRSHIAFADGHARGMKIEYFVEPRPLGTAGAIGFARPYSERESDFLVMNAGRGMDVGTNRGLR